MRNIWNQTNRDHVKHSNTTPRPCGCRNAQFDALSVQGTNIDGQTPLQVDVRMRLATQIVEEDRKRTLLGNQ